MCPCVWTHDDVFIYPFECTNTFHDRVGSTQTYRSVWPLIQFGPTRMRIVCSKSNKLTHQPIVRRSDLFTTTTYSTHCITISEQYLYLYSNLYICVSGHSKSESGRVWDCVRFCVLVWWQTNSIHSIAYSNCWPPLWAIFIHTVCMFFNVLSAYTHRHGKYFHLMCQIYFYVYIFNIITVVVDIVIVAYISVHTFSTLHIVV